MIELKDLTKQFDTLVAVDHVTLSVQAGEVLALLGPNGAGKTTTVRMLSAVLQPTAGGASVAGFDVVDAPQAVRQCVGVLTEAPGLYTRMSGYEYLDFFGQARGLDAVSRRQRIIALAEQFQMADVLDRRLGQYSKGMAQKIALMRTLLHNPPVLLLDEPTSAMDPQSARLVRDAIKQMRAQHRALIICTHNLPEAEELADRIAIISKGKILVEGTPGELRDKVLGLPVMEVRFVEPLRADAASLIGEMVPVLETSSHAVRYRTSEPARVNPQILNALATRQIAVLTLSELPRPLEAVYLQVMGERYDA